MEKQIRLAKSVPSGLKEKQAQSGRRWEHVLYEFYGSGTKISRATETRVRMQINSWN